MNFATWSIRSPLPPIVLFLLLTLAGVVGFSRLGIQLMPDVVFPAVRITTALPGAAAEQMETEVTRKIEDAVASISGVRHISSSISEGVSVTTAEFDMGQNIDEALIDVRDAVDQIRGTLPASLDEPVVRKIRMIEDMTELVYALRSSEMDKEDLSQFAKNTASRALLAVPGVGGLAYFGTAEPEIRVEISPEKLAALNVSLADVSAQLSRMQKDAAGGYGAIGGERQTVRVLAGVGSVEDLAALKIALPGGRHVRLDQVATIQETFAEPNNYARYNDDSDAVFIGVMRARDADSVTMSKKAAKAIETLAAENPDVKISLVFDVTEWSNESYNAALEMLFEGAFLAVLVVWLFLRDWRSTVIAAMALPLAIIPTFAVIYWMGFSLNQITLLALCLVTGLLVDDAIVEIENIVRHLRTSGQSPREAAMKAVTEIGLAVVATTMTLVAVFLPTAFMGGITGVIFQQFGWTAVVAVVMSLVVARLVTPMMSAWLLKPPPPEARSDGDGKTMAWYLALVERALRHRRLTMMLATLVFVGSLALIPVMPKDFLPEGDHGLIQSLDVALPQGSSPDEMKEIDAQVRHLLKPLPEIAYTMSIITGASKNSGGGGFNNVQYIIGLTPKGERNRSQKEVENNIREILKVMPGVRVSLGGFSEKFFMTFMSDDSSLLETTVHNIEQEIRTLKSLVLTGQDLRIKDKEIKLTDQEKQTLRSLGGVGNSLAETRPEIVVRPDLARAAELGVTTEAIGDALRLATAGNYDFLLPKLNLPDRQIPIRVQLPPEVRQDLAALEQLRVSGRNGPIPLGSVARLEMTSGPSSISRYDRNHSVTLSVELAGNPLGTVSQIVAKLPSVDKLPPGVLLQKSGYSEAMGEMMASFVGAILTGILCIYLVMLLLFKDCFQPLTILAALPLSLGGAFVLLLLTGMGISMSSLLGLIMLIGVATKNSILLVDYALIAMRDHGKTQTDALIDACRKRARPIVMTSLAMIAGMTPMALGLSGDDTMTRPMAITMIGGLATSTLLSLVVIPVVFTYTAAFEDFIRRLFRINKGEIRTQSG